MWATPIEVAVRTLLFPELPGNVPKETALQWLRDTSGEDLGDDAVAWIRWAKSAGHISQDYPEQFAAEQVTPQEHATHMLCSALTDADVRTDQADIVRVYWREVVGGIQPLADDGFLVTVGDGRAQSENIVFEASHSSNFQSLTDAVDYLVMTFKAIERARRGRQNDSTP